MKQTHSTIKAYNAAQTKVDKHICELLKIEIETALKNSESKIWHGSPVWFLDSNPIVGYGKQKAGIRLMFWSGVDFEEDALSIQGKKFKDASVFFTALEEINIRNLRRWLKKSKEIQWDYKNIVKRKGVLKKIESRKTESVQKNTNDTSAHDLRFAKMIFSSVYPLYLVKIEKKGRTKKELDEVIKWLTGFDNKKLNETIKEKDTFESFFKKATLNKNASLITGMICGYRVEDIKNPLTKKVRYLDKLVDELANGRKMGKILRS